MAIILNSNSHLPNLRNPVSKPQTISDVSPAHDPYKQLSRLRTTRQKKNKAPGLSPPLKSRNPQTLDPSAQEYGTSRPEAPSPLPQIHEKSTSPLNASSSYSGAPGPMSPRSAASSPGSRAFTLTKGSIRVLLGLLAFFIRGFWAQGLQGFGV